MRRFVRKLVMTVMLMSAVSVGNFTTATSAGALVGGESTPVAAGQAPWAAFLRGPIDTVTGTRPVCSAALVAPDWVLTAAHCLVNREGYLSTIVPGWNGLSEHEKDAVRAWFDDQLVAEPALFKPSQVTVKVGVASRNDSSRPWLPVDQVEVFDPYLTRKSTKSYDIALLHLTSPVSETPIAIADADSPADADLTKPAYRTEYPPGGWLPIAIPETFVATVGSGKTCEDCDSGQLRAAVTWVDERNDEATTFRHTRGGNDFVCKGDSGAPSIAMRQDGTWVVVGVMSMLEDYTFLAKIECGEYAWSAIVGRTNVADWVATVAPPVLTTSAWAASTIAPPAPNPQCDGHAATIVATPGTITYGTPGHDVIVGTPGDDVIEAGSGNDIICGYAGNDTIYGAAGNDTIFGGDGDDRLEGQADHDVHYGGNGNDVIKGNVGDDILRGEAGDDKLWGWDGTDSLWGGPGNDRLEGEAGNDRLYGDEDDDRLNGGPGDDLLAGKTGIDICIALEGNDNTKHGCETVKS